MKGSQAIHSGISRAEAIDLLWKLKHLSDNKLSLEVPHVHFNMLLVDPAYRAEIIAMALNANCKRVRELAQRIHDANLEGQLISNHAHEHDGAVSRSKTTRPVGCTADVFTIYFIVSQYGGDGEFLVLQQCG
ncbi:MAG: hypothetical protein P8104_06770 [Gammaproteobacteria bacterium]